MFDTCLVLYGNYCFVVWLIVWLVGFGFNVYTLDWLAYGYSVLVAFVD